MATVSVVIPSYNASEFISEAIVSIIGQNYKHVEIVVVDDGSTDNTSDVIKKFTDINIKYVYQENAGPGAARNRGIAEASGKYICFLDADDELLEESIYRRVKFLDDNQDIGLVFTDFYKVNTPGVRQSHADLNRFLEKFNRAVRSSSGDNYVFGDRFFECALEFDPFILTSTVMLRADVAKSVGFFNTQLKVAEDTDYWLRICRQYPVGYINKPLTSYNNYRSGLTANKVKAFEDPLIFYSQLLHDLYGNAKYKALLKRKISKIEFDYAYYLCGIEKYSESKKHYFRSFALYPSSFNSIKWAVVSLLPSSIVATLFNFKNKLKSNFL